MKLDTRDFGALEIDPAEVVRFRAGIFGFEELTEYVLLYDDTIDSPFVWLQSTEDRNVCFILTAPAAAGIAGYDPAIPAGTAKLIELADGNQPAVFAITVIPERFEDSTVNLKSPIVINPARKCAAQVILDADYPIRARLVPGEGGAPC